MSNYQCKSLIQQTQSVAGRQGGDGLRQCSQHVRRVVYAVEPLLLWVELEGRGRRGREGREGEGKEEGERKGHEWLRIKSRGNPAITGYMQLYLALSDGCMYVL